MTIEQRPEGDEGVNHVNMWKTIIPECGNSRYKGLEVGVYLACSKND